MRAMVVGGAGFVGSHLVDRLLAEEASVEVVDDLTAGSLANLAEARSSGGELRIHHLDAGSDEANSLIGMRRPDVVFHLAAVPRPAGSAADLAASLAATMRLLEACRLHAVEKVVVAVPATAIYGRPAAKELPLKEGTIEPRGVRGVVARAIIDLLLVHREEHAVEFTVLALASVYGPRQRPAAGVVAKLADAARRRQTVALTGDGRQTRDLLFVDDAVDAIARAVSRGGGLVINVGTGVQTAVRDVWQMLGAPTEPRFDAPRPDELMRFAISPVRARIHLGWSPWTQVSEGIGQLLRA